jgi:hypothetical protein
MLDPTATLILEGFPHIDLTVRPALPAVETFLPGFTLRAGGLIVDAERLRYHGDLVHETGHLATMSPAQRASVTSNAGSDVGDEIAART